MPHYVCSEVSCNKRAVGYAWFEGRKKWVPYCQEHLEVADGRGLPTKLASDTDIVYMEDVEGVLVD